MKNDISRPADIIENIFSELALLFSEIEEASIAPFIQTLKSGRRLFFYGAGRSGLAVRMAAMRFMHLGLAAHAVGEATCPAIAEGDVLLVASGSGRTPGIVAAAEKAREAGAAVLAITTDARSPLAGCTQRLIVLKAAVKDEHQHAASVQYAGSLFEQATLLLLDALFHLMWKASGQPADTLWTRHANME